MFTAMKRLLIFLLLTQAASAVPFRIQAELSGFPDKYLSVPWTKEAQPAKWEFGRLVYLFDQNGDDLRSGDLVTLGDYDAKTVLTLEGDKPVWAPGGTAQPLTLTQTKGKPQITLQIGKGKYLAGTPTGPVVSDKPFLWTYKRITRGNQAARDLMQEAIKKRGAEKVALYEKAFGMGATDASKELIKIYNLGESGLPADGKKAVEWGLKGAQAGDAETMHTLAFLLPISEGRGWLIKSAELGYLQAQKDLRDYEKIHPKVLPPGYQPPPVYNAPRAQPQSASTNWKYPVGLVMTNQGRNNPGCLDLRIESHNQSDGLYYILARYAGAKPSDWTVQTSPSYYLKQGTIREADLEREFKPSKGARYCSACQASGNKATKQIRNYNVFGTNYYGEWMEYTTCPDCHGTGLNH